MPLFEDPGELHLRDWPSGPPIVVDYLARASRRIRDFLRTKLSLSANIDCDVQTMRCTHGTEVKIKSRLLAPRGMSVISAGSGQVVESAKLIASGSTARVTVYFASGSGSADVTLVLWPEGSASGSGLTYYPALRPGLLSGTDGQVLTRDSTALSGVKWSTAGNAGGTGQAAYGSTRKWGAASIQNNTATALSAWAVTPALTGTLSNSSANGRSLIATGCGGANGVAGLTGSLNETRPTYQARAVVTGLFDGSGLSTMRYWCAITSAALGLVSPALAGGASAIHFVGVCADSTISANWLLVSGDGTNYSTIDTGIAVSAAAAVVRFTLDWTTPTSFVATLDSTTYNATPDAFSRVFSVTKTTNLSTSTTANCGLYFTTTQIGALARFSYISSYIIEQNP